MTVTPVMLDAILVLIGAEFLLIGLFLRARGQKRLIVPVGAFLLSGLALMLALKLALGGATGGAIAGLLAMSFVGHAGALVLAWRAVK